jgi:hypothetical protein
LSATREFATNIFELSWKNNLVITKHFLANILGEIHLATTRHFLANIRGRICLVTVT